MLVGTNNALRVSALRQIGGFQDSITEDMATGLALHGARNPQTSRRWTSVYTPDVVAVGEGPSSFTDYFSQQDRWSRGTDEVLTGKLWRMAHRLSPRALANYSYLLCYYPTVAVAWVLGALNGLLYFSLGAGGVQVPAHLWLMLYLDAATLQVGLYFYNRRHNVSPHEEEGSAGMMGLLISALSAPVYAASLAARAAAAGDRVRDHAQGRRRDPRRAEQPSASTSSGASSSASRWRSGIVLGHDHASMRVWSLLSLARLPAAGGDLADRELPAARPPQAAGPRPRRKGTEVETPELSWSSLEEVGS